MPIARLDAHLVNQIAAGEVVERPASVVKELIENCIDAGATGIEVVVEEGGAKLIRIADDGCGIPEAELDLALTAHATSKLATAQDLAAIDTLGFRGEALASIASVSRMRLMSRTHVAEGGAVVEQNGEERTGVRPAAMAPGTVIEVKDLFWNVPARRRFLRSDGAEYGQIADTVNRAAMANPEVGYTLSHNGRKTLSLPPGQSRRERCVAVLGKDLDDALIEFSFEGRAGDGSGGDEPGAEPPRVWGVAGEPSVARATSKFLHVYINGRPVKDRSLNHAVKEAYRGLMAGDRHPVAAVFIQMDPRLVDVNVHPTKAEVRFREPRMMHGLVRSPLRERLLESDITPSVVPSAGGAGGAGGLAGVGGGAGMAGGMAGGGGAREFVSAFQTMAPNQKGFVYEEVKRSMAADDLFVRESSSAPATPGPGADTSDTAGASGVTGVRVLQVHDSYVIAQDVDGVLIIDQHALHERVMFEAIQQRILGAGAGTGPGPGQGADLESQRMLMPLVIDADAARVALLDDAGPLLARLGIEAAAMGPAAIGVHAFPSLLLSRGVEPAAFIDGLLGRIEDGDLSGGADALESESALHKVLDMMSCKAAVKAGDRLTDAELAALLKTRDEVERSGSCPHGRPTTVRISLRELEKLFHR